MDYSYIVIGAGAVGLAIAQKLSQHSTKVLLLEKNASFGEETSSRNSEVIHAGIYYPKDSLKARLCVRGNSLLYEYCAKNNINHRKIGKYIIALEAADEESLERSLKSAHANGATEVDYVSLADLYRNNPDVDACAALYSPTTGIIDSHEYMRSLEAHTINTGGDVVYNHKVIGIDKISGGYELQVQTADGETVSIQSECVINSAGLGSDEIARMAGIDIDSENLRLSYCKGRYFKIAPSAGLEINNLIYPTPAVNYVGLGIHLTLDLSGGMKLGPDTMYIDDRCIDYSVDQGLHEKFYVAAKRYLPKLSPDDISPDYSGVRPKLQKADEAVRDFYIREESERNLPGMINLIGIESPGLTSSLAIAEYVFGLINSSI